MNKTQLVDALAERLGDRRTAVTAVEGMLDTIVEAVRTGESVTITGFGVFEGRARAARVGRNPRTGEPIDVPATTVPAFRPGAGFRTAVGGNASAPAPRPAARATGTVTAVAEAPATAAPAKTSPAKATKVKADTTFAPKPVKAGKAAKTEKPKAPKGKAEKPKKSKPKK